MPSETIQISGKKFELYAIIVKNNKKYFSILKSDNIWPSWDEDNKKSTNTDPFDNQSINATIQLLFYRRIPQGNSHHSADYFVEDIRNYFSAKIHVGCFDWKHDAEFVKMIQADGEFKAKIINTSLYNVLSKMP